MHHDPFSNPLVGLIGRTAGPLKFRFVLQPLMAIFLAIRSGIKDSREGKPPFFWDFCVEPTVRQKLIQDCWKSVGKVFILAFVLDCAYQVIELRWIYMLDALAVAFFLAIVPYVIVRGPVNRIATERRRATQATEKHPAVEQFMPNKTEDSSTVKKAV
jgi:hypothetical protein